MYRKCVCMCLCVYVYWCVCVMVCVFPHVGRACQDRNLEDTLTSMSASPLSLSAVSIRRLSQYASPISRQTPYWATHTPHNSVLQDTSGYGAGDLGHGPVPHTTHLCTTTVFPWGTKQIEYQNDARLHNTRRFTAQSVVVFGE